MYQDSTITTNNVNIKSINESEKIISYFGKLILKPVMNGVFTGFNLTKEESQKIIMETVNTVLSGKYDLINILIVDNAIRQYSFDYDDIFNLLEMIYQLLSTNTKRLADSIQTDITKKKFTIESFIEIRKNYF